MGPGPQSDSAARSPLAGSTQKKPGPRRRSSARPRRVGPVQVRGTGSGEAGEGEVAPLTFRRTGVDAFEERAPGMDGATGVPGSCCLSDGARNGMLRGATPVDPLASRESEDADQMVRDVGCWPAERVVELAGWIGPRKPREPSLRLRFLMLEESRNRAGTTTKRRSRRSVSCAGIMVPIRGWRCGPWSSVTASRSRPPNAARREKAETFASRRSPDRWVD